MTLILAPLERRSAIALGCASKSARRVYMILVALVANSSRRWSGRCTSMLDRWEDQGDDVKSGGLHPRECQLGGPVRG